MPCPTSPGHRQTDPGQRHCAGPRRARRRPSSRPAPVGCAFSDHGIAVHPHGRRVVGDPDGRSSAGRPKGSSDNSTATSRLPPRRRLRPSRSAVQRPRRRGPASGALGSDATRGGARRSLGGRSRRRDSGRTEHDLRTDPPHPQQHRRGLPVRATARRPCCPARRRARRAAGSRSLPPSSPASRSTPRSARRWRRHVGDPRTHPVRAEQGIEQRVGQGGHQWTRCARWRIN